MRNYCYLFCFLLLVNGCKKTDTGTTDTPPPTPAPQLSVSATNITLGSITGSKDSFNITSNISWTISVTPSTATWFSVSTLSGSNNAIVYVTATANNTSGSNQTATIVLTPVGTTAVQPINIIVNQNSQALQLSASASSITLGSTTGSKDSFTVTSNISWTIALSPSTATWASLSTYSGSNNAKIYITATQDNASAASKIATIILSPVGNTSLPPVNITLTQNFLPSGSAFTLLWQKTLGGTGGDFGYSITSSADGGYVVAGNTLSNDGDVTGNHGNSDVWVVKLNSTGAIVWQKTMGGSSGDYAYSITSTSDGGYILAGTTRSNDGDVTGNHGDVDIWVVKINGTGNIVWQKTYGGSGTDWGNKIISTSDGGYVVIGYTNSNDGDVSGNHGQNDGWVIKLNSTGGIMWQKLLGGSLTDLLNSVTTTSDGGYIVTGSTYSNDGDVSGNHGDRDGWVIKLNSTGNIVWKKLYGGTALDDLGSIIATSDGNYIIVGATQSNNGDVSGNHGFYDGWIIKIDGNGNIIWKKVMGGSGLDGFNSALINSQNELVVIGETQSNDGDVSGFKGGEDVWIVKLDANGNTLDKKVLGGSDNEAGLEFIASSDGYFVMIGETGSNNGDVSGNHGSRDYWVVKFKFQ